MHLYQEKWKHKKNEKVHLLTFIGRIVIANCAQTVGLSLDFTSARVIETE